MPNPLCFPLKYLIIHLDEYETSFLAELPSSQLSTNIDSINANNQKGERSSVEAVINVFISNNLTQLISAVTGSSQWMNA